MKQFLPHSSPPHALTRRCIAPLALSVILALSLCTTITSYGQSSLTGKVTTSEDNAPLPGVSILIKGTQLGTTTDIDGSFTLQTKSSDVLVFSFIGYVTQEIAVNEQTSLSIAMVADLQQLSEVVVVGYGTVKKTDLTGAVGLVDNQQLTKRGSVNAMEAMQGQVAGVDISNATGRAGSGFNIQIRGVQSFKGGQPLYVVDGVIMPEGIGFLNPQDIERIDILKDASSAAIYGSRGAYGVVLVTTKGGANVKDQAVISYDGYVGVRQAARLPKFMDGDTWWNWRQDSFISDAIVRNQAIPANPGYNSTGPELQRRLDEGDYTDWPSLLIQDGFQSNHWLSFSGRGEKMGYTFGAGYQDEQGNIANEHYKRYNFKASIDHALNQHWTTGANISLSFEDQNFGSPNSMLEAFRMNPIMSPYDVESGELIVSPGKDEITGQPGKYHIDFTSSVNPLIDQQKAYQDGHATYAIGNVFLQYAPISWLKFKTTISPRYTTRSRGQYLGRDSEGRVGGLPYAQRQLNESFSYIWDNQISASKTINDHHFDAIGLFSSNYFVNEMTFVAQDNMDASAKGYYAIGVTGDKTKVTSNSDYSKETLLSFAARLNYTFKDKYLVTLTSRWDGASVLAEGNKWASFPSAAIGWKLSEESFLSNSAVVDNLKLRASYGFTGNKVIDPYMTMATASTPTFYDYGGTLASGIRPDLIANKNLTWERTSELNLGLDYSFFKGRVGGTVDVYNKVSKDLIVSRQLPLESGWQTVYQNIGEVVNKGIEVALTTVNISNTNLEWSTTLNFAKNNNEVTQVYDGTDIIYVVLNNGAGDGYNADDAIIKGHPIGSYYNWVADGVWQAGETQAATYGQLEGQGRVVDYDENNVINQDDKRVVGSVLPTWTGGFSSTLNYKGFDFSFSLMARQGMTAYSPFHAEFTNHEDRGRSKLDINWYMQSNPVTESRVSEQYPQPKNAGIYWRTYSVGYYRDASFVKVKNITLGYTFSNDVMDKLGLKNLRLYGNVTNPFVFTDYDGFDPEWATATYANGGMSFITYQLGVNAKF